MQLELSCEAGPLSLALYWKDPLAPVVQIRVPRRNCLTNCPNWKEMQERTANKYINLSVHLVKQKLLTQQTMLSLGVTPLNLTANPTELIYLVPSGPRLPVFERVGC